MQRFVLFSLFGYEDAVLHDGSLKFLSDEEAYLPDLIETVGIEEADYLDQGITRTTTDVDPEHRKNIAAARSVAERLIHYIWDCDRMGPDGMATTVANHRPQDAIADIHYPMHGIICVDRVAMGQPLADFLNDKFTQEPSRYPRDKGWHAEVVHSEVAGADGERLSGKPITTNHPWLRYKDTKILDTDCARILIVIGMGREGLDNPYCGVYGLTSQIQSIVFIVQATIGRTLRAVTSRMGTPEGREVIPRPSSSARYATIYYTRCRTK